MQYPRQPPLLYYDIWQKSTLFVSGALVGESPHGLEGSCIYLSLIYSKYNIHGMTVYHFFCSTNYVDPDDFCPDPDPTG
jgi:hypothetical protein